MANILGSAQSDFIHATGDGQVYGGNEITGVTAGGDSITAGAGNDVVFGAGGNDTISGNDGFDTVMGGQGADRMTGGLGNDVFRMQGVSDIDGLAEVVNGGADSDTLDFTFFAASGAVDLSLATLISIETLSISANDVTLTSAQLGAFAGIFGSGFQDRLFLTDGGLVDLTGATIQNIDEIRGNDLANQLNLTGVALGQYLNLQGGNDAATGSDGSDRIDGGVGQDSLTGAAGNDTLLGGDDNDSLQGGAGGDLIDGGVGLDTLLGGLGNDTLRVSFTSDISGLAEVFDGGADNDTLDFQSAFAGGAVNITAAQLTNIENLTVQAIDLTLRAGQLGAFTGISGTGFAERLILLGGGTADLTGAQINGIDEFRGSGAADTIILTDVTTGQFVDGRVGNDTILGTLAADLLVGGAGADAVSGSDGADTLRGGQGADSVSGGTGNDTFQLLGISDLNGLAETIDGGNDNDTLDLQTFNATGRIDLTLATILNVEALRLVDNVVKMTAAQLTSFETISGTGFYERIQISAAAVVDLTNAAVTGIDEFTGTSGDDTFLFAGTTGNVTVKTLGGADSVSGGDGNDTLLGGAGNDTLVGGVGSDVIVGQVGTDRMTGGQGGDRFDFDDPSELGLNAARDVITDFVHGQDVIDLSDMDSNLNVAGSQSFQFIGAAAFSAAGQVRYTGGILSADTDGDGTADWQIALTGTPVVTITDFLL